MEMENHKQKLDKEYEELLQQFSKELEKIELRHEQEREKKVPTFHMPFLISKS